MKNLQQYTSSAVTKFLFQERRDYSQPETPNLSGDTKQEAKTKLKEYKGKQQANIDELKSTISDLKTEMKLMAQENITTVQDIEAKQMEFSETFMDLTVQLLDVSKLSGMFDRYMLPQPYNKKFLKNIFKGDSTKRFGIADFTTYAEPSEYYNFIKTADAVATIINEGQEEYFLPMENKELFEQGKAQLLAVAQKINELTEQRNRYAAMPHAYHKNMDQRYFYGEEGRDERDAYNQLFELKEEAVGQLKIEEMQYEMNATKIGKQAREAGKKTKYNEKMEERRQKELQKNETKVSPKDIKQREKNLQKILDKNN